MDMKKLSSRYEVRSIKMADVPAVLRLCEGNPQYYQYCPPEVTAESIRADMCALPKGKTAEDKYYLGFWDNTELVAVLDLIVRYPDTETAFIGFFMMNAKWQGKGVGSEIVREICDGLKTTFCHIRLGYVKGNPQSEHFWLKNQFEPTGVVTQTPEYDIVILKREI